MTLNSVNFVCWNLMKKWTFLKISCSWNLTSWYHFGEIVKKRKFRAQLRQPTVAVCDFLWLAYWIDFPALRKCKIVCINQWTWVQEKLIQSVYVHCLYCLVWRFAVRVLPSENVTGTLPKACVLIAYKMEVVLIVINLGPVSYLGPLLLAVIPTLLCLTVKQSLCPNNSLPEWNAMCGLQVVANAVSIKRATICWLKNEHQHLQTLNIRYIFGRRISRLALTVF